MSPKSQRRCRPVFGGLLALAVTLASAVPVAASSLDEAMAKLREVVTREAKPGATPPPDYRAAQHAMLLGRLQTDIAHQRWQDANMQLNIFGQQEGCPEMLQLIHELRLEVLKQIDARENAVVARIEATIKSASQICANARNPGEIDDVFRELSDIRPPEGLQKERVRGAVEKLNGAIDRKSVV